MVRREEHLLAGLWQCRGGRRCAPGGILLVKTDVVLRLGPR
jgi:hypothetical protein